MFPKRLLALVAVIGTLAYIGITHSAALITYITDLLSNDHKSEDDDPHQS